MAHRILVINPGSTTTKIAVFKDNQPLFIRSIRHEAADLAGFDRIADQFEYRKRLILTELENEGISPKDIDVVMARGGLIRPIESGVYQVNEAMLKDLENGVMGEHASNLGGLIAADLVTNHMPQAQACIADPVVVDELEPVARVTGHPLFSRISIFHALNQKAVAREYAASVSKTYEELRLIVAHLGGGISVGAHRMGRVIDVNNALDGGGPLSPERSGTLPTGQLVDLCFSGRYTWDEVRKMLVGKGGFTAHLGSSDAIKAVNAAEAGDVHAHLIVDALSYNVAKHIGAMATVLEGKVDAILLTGGMARDSFICDYIRGRVEFIAPVHVFPGEDEMEALAMAGSRLLSGEITAKVYRPD